MKGKLTVWEAACIVTGYGIGGGVMAMPYLAAQNGIAVSMIILVVSCLISLLMHMMIADLSLRANSGQVVEIYERFLFKGRFKSIFTVIFFVMVALVMLTTLATYITGAGEIINAYLKVPTFVARLIFYAVAASVVLFGLKAVGVSEKIVVSVIFALITVFAIASLLNVKNPFPAVHGAWNNTLAYFSIAMFSFVAFFSIPQAVEGLGGDVKKIRTAVILGFINIFVIIFIIVVCAMLSSEEITGMAMIGWSAGIGAWAQLVGSTFTLLAIITTYWSISLALADIIKAQFKLDVRICWLLSTLPTLFLTLVRHGGFLEFIRITSGINAILIAILIIPTFNGANKEGPTRMLGKFAALPVQIFVVAAYLLMAAGSMVAI
jgi:amino acid permease